MPLINRQFFSTGVQLREADGDTPSRTIRGYAVTFGVPSVPLWIDGDTEYREIIDASAITLDLLNNSDIKLTMYHDRQLLLARSNHGSGSLRYGIDDHGVWFETELPNTADGDTARELIARGDLNGCSFMFSTDYDDPACVATERNANQVIFRVRRIEAIYDFTLAADPAYPSTSVELRELVEARQARESDTNTNNNTPQTQIQMENEPTPNPTPAAAAVVQRQTQSLTAQVREAFSRSRHCEIVFAREGESGTPSTSTTTTSDATITTTTAANAVPVTIQGVLDEIDAGLIWHNLGLQPVYNAAGELVWLVPGCGSAKFVGEKVAIAPQTIDIGKISAKAERLAVNYEVTYESLYHTEGVVESIVMKSLALAAQRAINTAILSTTKPEGSASIQGPFVAASASSKLVSIPKAYTYKDLNKLKAKLLAGGVAMAPVSVVHPSTYCDLEATPKDTGSGIMMIEGGKLLGYPVFISDAVPENYIGMGDFAQQAIGFTGDMRLIVDQYTKADSNVVRFILNFGLLTATLRPDAFVVGKIATA